jgi:cytochrome c5
MPILVNNQTKGENHMSKISKVILAFLTPLLGKMKERAKGRFSRTMMILIAVWLVMMAVSIVFNSGSSQPTQALLSGMALAAETPALDGATLLEKRCSVCHSADRSRQAKKTREQWEQTVTRMIGKGAKLTEAEKTVLVDYLAKTYKP